MKATPILSFIFLIPCFSFSQNYLSNNLSWAYYGTGYGGIQTYDKYFYWEYTSGEDSIINNLSYYKINTFEIDSEFQYSNDSLIHVYAGVTNTVYLVRENGKQIYCINNYGRDTLLWDFNLSIGNLLPGTYLTGCYLDRLDSIKTIAVSSYSRNIYYTYSIGFQEQNWAFIEGIGSYQGLFNNICGGIGIEGGMGLVCYSKDGADFVLTPYYDTTYNLNPYFPPYQNFPCFPPDYKAASVNEISGEETIEVFPNPASSYFQIKCPIPTGHVYVFRLYDETGREVKQEAIQTTSSTVQRGNITNGLYFWEMVSNNQVISRGKLILN